MGGDFIPIAEYAGVAGSIFSAPIVVSLDAGIAQVIDAGTYYLYATNGDIDLEVVTATVPTWTKFRDGTTADAMLIISDGYNVRLKNTGATPAQTGSLIKIG